jgi:hypothetical protein
MPRWDITDPDRVHTSDVRVPPEDPRTRSNSASPSVGRAGTGSDSSVNKMGRLERSTETRAHGASERRTRHQDHGHSYSLRESEMQAIADIGRFRAVDVKDLARFAYQGDEARMKFDLGNLRTQGLVEEKTFFRAHKSARKIVTLTERGHRIAREASGLAKEQRIYHGIVKPRELDHDADLYKVYQKAVEKIQEKGGKPVRVRLDFEIKESINHEKEAAGRLPEEMRRRWLRAVAEEHGLTIDGTTIHLPDIQVEYETADGGIERENLELLSRNYREEGIRGKAAAGFKIYARSKDTNRIRRALRDTGLVREVLSV